MPYLAFHVSYNGLQFGQNLLLSRWVDKLEADEPDIGAMWSYIGVSFGVIVAVLCRCVFCKGYLSVCFVHFSLFMNMMYFFQQRDAIGWLHLEFR